MKFWKVLLRGWITLASLTSFLGGWIVLAHAPKPNQFNPAKLAPMPALEPVPSLDQIMNSRESAGVNFFSNTPRRIRLRTGGS
jgi:hypothetical protein